MYFIFRVLVAASAAKKARLVASRFMATLAAYTLSCNLIINVPIRWQVKYKEVPDPLVSPHSPVIIVVYHKNYKKSNSIIGGNNVIWLHVSKIYVMKIEASVNSVSTLGVTMIAEQLALNPGTVAVPDDLTLTLRWALLLPARACAVAALLVEAAQAEGKWVARSVDQLAVAAKAHQDRTLCPGLVSELFSLDTTVLSGALILKQWSLAAMRGDDICLTAEFVRLYG